MSNQHRFREVDERLLLQSVARALDVLEVFAHNPKARSLGEIATAAGIHKSAAQRIGQTLLSRGYLEQSEEGRLTLGRMFLDRSFDYLRSNPLIERAMPVLTQLRKKADERVDLSLFDAEYDNLSIVHAIRMQSKRESFYATLAGRRMHTFMSTGGRACLALLPDEVVDDILQRSDRQQVTPKTITDIDGIWDKVREARRTGYAYAAEEALLGEVVVAAAVRSSSGVPIGAVHIAGSLSEWSPEGFRERFSPLALEAAQALNF
ncbi:IclR family transcriptional regulator [Xylophilus sp. GOD-11R]|uniref:IclR family transcriptional regulator n=1 Tax=Xylophilus sp. GOD-11R TaxID=3089814 RepID=UPI00298C9DDD|nr:IclR family transcriptional regulator [Xylophilus sp. GOD-11R]WPB55780.1 IclR family transcriptional regulator [Xylophilus sp. GOD-11R]